uniref:NPA domain-containing protein n=1 Tax=Steinernema glaseri TaxID=37863 RepID=A0A1I7YGB1_9BILA
MKAFHLFLALVLLSTAYAQCPWLTEEQKDELKQMKENDKSRQEIQAQIFKYFSEATEDVQGQAKEELQFGCRELLLEDIGEEEAYKLKASKESDVSAKELAKKLQELLSEVNDKNNFEIVTDFTPICKKLFG